MQDEVFVPRETKKRAHSFPVVKQEMEMDEYSEVDSEVDGHFDVEEGYEVPGAGPSSRSWTEAGPLPISQDRGFRLEGIFPFEFLTKLPFCHTT